MSEPKGYHSPKPTVRKSSRDQSKDKKRQSDKKDIDHKVPHARTVYPEGYTPPKIDEDPEEITLQKSKSYDRDYRPTI